LFDFADDCGVCDLKCHDSSMFRSTSSVYIELFRREKLSKPQYAIVLIVSYQ
jgi:hypothetical protein